MNYGKLTAGTTKTAIDTAKPSEKGEIITYLSRMGDVLCPVADRVKIVAALDRRIHAVVYCDEPHILLREIDLHVVADLQVLTPQPGGILYNQGGDLPGFDHFHDLFPTRPLKICSGIPVVRKKKCVFKAFIPCIFFQQIPLMLDAV